MQDLKHVYEKINNWVELNSKTFNDSAQWIFYSGKCITLEGDRPWAVREPASKNLRNPRKNPRKEVVGGVRPRPDSSITPAERSRSKLRVTPSFYFTDQGKRDSSISWVLPGSKWSYCPGKYKEEMENEKSLEAEPELTEHSKVFIFFIIKINNG